MSQPTEWLRVMQQSIAACSLFLTCWGCGEAIPDEGKIDEQEAEVIGGVFELGYPSAGYLTMGPAGGSPTSKLCSAVQVGPELVLTAAHCAVAWIAKPYDIIANQKSWGYGRGQFAAQDIRTAAALLVHPGYDPNATLRYENDLALVVFSAPIGGTWAEIIPPTLGTNCGTPSASTGHTYVGYGYDGSVSNNRKSATQCNQTLNPKDLISVGVNGGLCPGDSGGPLFTTGNDRAVGVLSDWAGPACQVGNALRYTRLDAYKPFICPTKVYVGNGEFCGRSLAAETGVTSSLVLL